MAFWLVKTNGVRRAVLVFKDVCSGIFLPLTLFPVQIQKVLFFLPFQFISYVPARVFMGSYELAGMTFSIPQIVGLQALMVLLTYLLNRLVCRGSGVSPGSELSMMEKRSGRSPFSKTESTVGRSIDGEPTNDAY